MAAYKYNFELRIASYAVRTRRVFSLGPYSFALMTRKLRLWHIKELVLASWEHRWDLNPGPYFPVKDTFCLIILIFHQRFSKIIKSWAFFLYFINSPPFFDVWHIYFWNLLELGIINDSWLTYKEAIWLWILETE